MRIPFVDPVDASWGSVVDIVWVGDVVFAAVAIFQRLVVLVPVSQVETEVTQKYPVSRRSGVARNTPIHSLDNSS